MKKTTSPKDLTIKTLLVEVVEKLYDDLIKTYIKFANLQEDMEAELELEEDPLPDNVLKFPGDQ